MKVSTIRNALIRQTIIVSVIVGVIGGGLWYVSSLDTECDANIGKLKQEADDITKQADSLAAEYSKVTSTMKVYKEIKQKQDNKMLSVNKLVLRDVIAGYRNKTYFDSPDVKMDEIKSLEGEKYKRSTAFIESSVVTINMKAISDVDVLGLIRTLEKSFSSIKFTSLHFLSEKHVDNAALIAIKDTGFVPMVSAKITFTLFGLRNINSADGDLLTDSANSLPQASGSDAAARVKQGRP